jgi:hypothetical protein
VQRAIFSSQFEGKMGSLSRRARCSTMSECSVLLCEKLLEWILLTHSLEYAFCGFDNVMM